MMSIPLTVVSLFEMTVRFLSWMVDSLHLACLEGLIGAASARELDPIALGKLVHVLWNPFSAISAKVSGVSSVSGWSKLSVVIGSFLAPPLLLELLPVSDLHLADFSVLVLPRVHSDVPLLPLVSLLSWVTSMLVTHIPHFRIPRLVHLSHGVVPSAAVLDALWYWALHVLLLILLIQLPSVILAQA